MQTNKGGQTKPSGLNHIFLTCKRALLFAALFSFGINVLTLASPLYSLQVFDRVLSSGSMETLLMLSIIVLILFLFLGALQAIRSFVFMQIGAWMDKKLSPAFLIASIRISALQKTLSGSQALRDLGTVKQFITGQPLQQLFDAPWAIIFILVLFLIHPIIGGIVCLFALLLFGMAIINEWQTKKPHDEANDAYVKNMKDVEMMTRNADVIESMGMVTSIVTLWDAVNLNAVNKHIEANRKATIIASITKTIRMTIQMVTMAVSTYLVLANKMTPGGIIAASILSGKALAPFDAAIATWKSVLGARKAYRRLKTVEEKAPDRDEAMTLPEPDGKLTAEKLFYAIQGSPKPILKAIDFELQAGEAMGLIGPSAAGKTTLAKCIVGVWKPSSGIVRLDDADIYTWNREQVGQYVGFLPQEIELFHGTVKDNIARMNPAADPQTVIDAAKIAGCHQMILKLPQGYDTQIGVSGSKLSAGQRQRIGLARAFYGTPKLIVLDEPNAHMDQVGEAALLKALDHAKNHAITVIVISHRPSILAKIDKVLVLNDGQLQQFGPRDEVLATVMPKAIQKHGGAS
jgi:PrtD family type I secretion system ABC transporter